MLVLHKTKAKIESIFQSRRFVDNFDALTIVCKFVSFFHIEGNQLTQCPIVSFTLNVLLRDLMNEIKVSEKGEHILPSCT